MADRLRIMLVDDDEDDVRLTREALKECAVAPDLDVASDGEEALRRLRADAPGGARPDIVLLDLNLPRLPGREVLRRIRAEPSLRAVPVIVLSTSEAEDDVAGCYELGANCYIPKPVGFGEFRRVVRAIEEFWSTVARLP